MELEFESQYITPRNLPCVCSPNSCSQGPESPQAGHVGGNSGGPSKTATENGSVVVERAMSLDA